MDQLCFDARIDLRPGGRWSIINRRDGVEYTASGEYLEVTPPVRLVYTYAMLQFSPNSDTITVELTPDGDGCLIALYLAILYKTMSIRQVIIQMFYQESENIAKEE